MGSDQDLGPRPSAAPRPLSQARAAVLEQLAEQPGPASLAALTDATGLHANTLRGHLEALVHAGLVRRTRAEPSGRGRPAWLYEVRADAGYGEYAGLAAALAASIARTSPDPAAEATRAGEEWGRRLAHDRDTSAASPAAARERVVGLLDDLGFGPVPDPVGPELVRLTRCPLLAAAQSHPEVVCRVHLGIVRGALETYDADPTGTTLVPFAEPGACRLVVPPLDGRSTAPR